MKFNPVIHQGNMTGRARFEPRARRSDERSKRSGKLSKRRSRRASPEKTISYEPATLRLSGTRASANANSVNKSAGEPPRLDKRNQRPCAARAAAALDPRRMSLPSDMDITWSAEFAQATGPLRRRRTSSRRSPQRRRGRSNTAPGYTPGC